MAVTSGITVPYLPSVEWMSGHTTAPLSSRDYTRTSIASNTGAGMVLTVPVVGGASAVKRLPPEMLEVSGHGDWPRIHLGAIEAAYGCEPYFRHLFPEIEVVISSYPVLLTDMNALLMGVMKDFLDWPDTALQVAALWKREPLRCRCIAERIVSRIDVTHSMIEPLFRFGRDAVFVMLNDEFM